MRVVVGPGELTAGQRIHLGEAEVQHLKVRRARGGEKVEVLNGAGFRGSGTLVQAGREWMVDVDSAEQLERPPALILAVATGDRERFSWLVEKAVELAVTQIVPLETERTASVATRLKTPHVDRLSRTALEALKQCGAAWAPAIEHPVALAEFLVLPLSGTGWLADQGGDPAPAAMDTGPVSIIVGPEGGLTDDEREAAVASGYRPVSLGLHTLRFETAALAGAAAITQARMRGAHD
jgi:16S rRNA (uracil1498-N3)-methyltransferase